MNSSQYLLSWTLVYILGKSPRKYSFSGLYFFHSTLYWSSHIQLIMMAVKKSSHLFTISIKMPCFPIQRMLCSTFHTFGRWHKQKGSRWSHRGGANTWLRVLSLLRYQRPLKHNRKILNITNCRTALFSLFLLTEQQAKDVKGALFHFCIVH